MFEKHGPEAWVEEGAIEDDDIYFKLMRERFGYDIG
jgi:hypothetical protein